MYNWAWANPSRQDHVCNEEPTKAAGFVTPRRQSHKYNEDDDLAMFMTPYSTLNVSSEDETNQGSVIAKTVSPIPSLNSFQSAISFPSAVSPVRNPNIDNSKSGNHSDFKSSKIFIGSSGCSSIRIPLQSLSNNRHDRLELMPSLNDIHGDSKTPKGLKPRRRSIQQLRKQLKLDAKSSSTGGPVPLVHSKTSIRDLDRRIRQSNVLDDPLEPSECPPPPLPPLLPYTTKYRYSSESKFQNSLSPNLEQATDPISLVKENISTICSSGASAITRHAESPHLCTTGMAKTAVGALIVEGSKTKQLSNVVKSTAKTAVGALVNNSCSLRNSVAIDDVDYHDNGRNSVGKSKIKLEQSALTAVGLVVSQRQKENVKTSTASIGKNKDMTTYSSFLSMAEERGSFLSTHERYANKWKSLNDSKLIDKSNNISYSKEEEIEDDSDNDQGATEKCKTTKNHQSTNLSLSRSYAVLMDSREQNLSSPLSMRSQKGQNMITSFILPSPCSSESSFSSKEEEERGKRTTPSSQSLAWLQYQKYQEEQEAEHQDDDDDDDDEDEKNFYMNKDSYFDKGFSGGINGVIMADDHIVHNRNNSFSSQLGLFETAVKPSYWIEANHDYSSAEKKKSSPYDFSPVVVEDDEQNHLEQQQSNDLDIQMDLHTRHIHQYHPPSGSMENLNGFFVTKTGYNGVGGENISLVSDISHNTDLHSLDTIQNSYSSGVGGHDYLNHHRYNNIVEDNDNGKWCKEVGSTHQQMEIKSCFSKEQLLIGLVQRLQDNINLVAEVESLYANDDDYDGKSFEMNPCIKTPMDQDGIIVGYTAADRNAILSNLRSILLEIENNGNETASSSTHRISIAKDSDRYLHRSLCFVISIVESAVKDSSNGRKTSCWKPKHWLRKRIGLANVTPRRGGDTSLFSFPTSSTPNDDINCHSMGASTITTQLSALHQHRCKSTEITARHNSGPDILTTIEHVTTIVQKISVSLRKCSSYESFIHATEEIKYHYLKLMDTSIDILNALNDAFTPCESFEDNDKENNSNPNGKPATIITSINNKQLINSNRLNTHAERDESLPLVDNISMTKTSTKDSKSITLKKIVESVFEANTKKEKEVDKSKDSLERTERNTEKENTNPTIHGDTYDEYDTKPQGSPVQDYLVGANRTPWNQSFDSNSNNSTQNDDQSSTITTQSIPTTIVQVPNDWKFDESSPDDEELVDGISLGDYDSRECEDTSRSSNKENNITVTRNEETSTNEELTS